MKSLLSKFVHLIIMPCSCVPPLLEQREAGELPLGKRIRLVMHLYICRWCSAYEKKMRWIDRYLLQKSQASKSLDRKEIDAFKDKLKKKIFR